MLPVEDDPFNFARYADPYPNYRRVRETTPVYWSQLLHGWVLTRHEERRGLVPPPLHLEGLGPAEIDVLDPGAVLPRLAEMRLGLAEFAEDEELLPGLGQDPRAGSAVELSQRPGHPARVVAQEAQ